jgi:hypothetical protein
MVEAADLTGWLDYDRDRLPSLDNAERITYFEKRVRLVTLNPLRRILAHEIFLPHEPDPTSAVLIFGVSICCAINSRRFHAFLRRYMSREFETHTVGVLTYGEALWAHFRNGIAHGYSVCHGGFEGHPTEPYFKTCRIAGHDSLKINPTLFFDDFRTGFERYVAELRGVAFTDPLFLNFGKVFEGVFIQGD